MVINNSFKNWFKDWYKEMFFTAKIPTLNQTIIKKLYLQIFTYDKIIVFGQGSAEDTHMKKNNSTVILTTA